MHDVFDCQCIVCVCQFVGECLAQNVAISPKMSASFEICSKYLYKQKPKSYIIIWFVSVMCINVSAA